LGVVIPRHGRNREDRAEHESCRVAADSLVEAGLVKPRQDLHMARGQFSRQVGRLQRGLDGHEVRLADEDDGFVTESLEEGLEMVAQPQTTKDHAGGVLGFERAAEVVGLSFGVMAAVEPECSAVVCRDAGGLVVRAGGVEDERGVGGQIVEGLCELGIVAPELAHVFEEDRVDRRRRVHEGILLETGKWKLPPHNVVAGVHIVNLAGDAAGEIAAEIRGPSCRPRRR